MGVLNLAWIVVVGILALSLAAVVIMTYRPPATFSERDQLEVRELYPGGRFLEGSTVYRRCEHGSEVRYFPDGLKLYFGGRPCWR